MSPIETPPTTASTTTTTNTFEQQQQPEQPPIDSLPLNNNQRVEARFSDPFAIKPAPCLSISMDDDQERGESCAATSNRNNNSSFGGALRIAWKSKQDMSHVIQPRMHTRVDEHNCTVVELDLSSMNLWSLRSGIISAMSKLQHLKELSLSKNNLSALPIRFKELRHLVTLNLSHNHFHDVPVELVVPNSTLELLDLSYNAIASVPPKLSAIKSLRLLNLSHNQLAALPYAFGDLHNLRLLYLSHNLFSSVPACILRLDSLLRLSLSYNQLQFLPDAIGTALPHMSDLDVRANDLVVLPHSLPPDVVIFPQHIKAASSAADDSSSKSASSLAASALTFAPSPAVSALLKSQASRVPLRLVVSGNRLVTLESQRVRHLAHLTTLELTGRHLTAIPEEFGLLSCLKHLDLSNNRLYRLPFELKRLHALRSIKLDTNAFESIPLCLAYLPHLTKLSMANNYMRVLRIAPAPGEGASSNGGSAAGSRDSVDGGEAALDLFPLLLHLDLRGNHLSDILLELHTAFPALLGLNLASNHFVRLISRSNTCLQWPAAIRTIDLSNNRLVSIVELGTPLELRYLNLQHNQLSSIPYTLAACTMLATLELHHNPLDCMPAEVASMSTPQLLQFLRQVHDDCTEPRRPKVMILGEEKAGKTQLASILSNILAGGSGSTTAAGGAMTSSTSSSSLSSSSSSSTQINSSTETSNSSGGGSSSSNTSTTASSLSSSLSSIVPPLSSSNSSTSTTSTVNASGNSRRSSHNSYSKLAGRSSYKHDSIVKSKISIRFCDYYPSNEVFDAGASQSPRTTTTTATTSTATIATSSSSSPGAASPLSQTMSSSPSSSNSDSMQAAAAAITVASPRSNSTSLPTLQSSEGLESLRAMLTTALHSSLWGMCNNKLVSLSLALSLSLSLTLTLSSYVCVDFSGATRDTRLTHQYFLNNNSVFFIVFNLAKSIQIKELTYWLSSIQSHAPQSHVFLVGTHQDSKKCTDEYIRTQGLMVERLYTTWTILVQKNATMLSIHRCDDYIASDGSACPLIFWPVSLARSTGLLQLKQRYLQVLNTLHVQCGNQAYGMCGSITLDITGTHTHTHTHAST
jgi:Leucine-rich repeat (LRR) protein